MGRIAAIDYGIKRIGLALSDERHIIASNLSTIIAERNSQLTAAKIIKELEKHNLEKIVIGLPLMLSGKKGILADEVEHFIEALQKFTSLPIIPWDERLTSLEATRIMKAAEMSRKKRKANLDNVTAVIILQSYLDCQSSLRALSRGLQQED